MSQGKKNLSPTTHLIVHQRIGGKVDVGPYTVVLLGIDHDTHSVRVEVQDLIMEEVQTFTFTKASPLSITEDITLTIRRVGSVGNGSRIHYSAPKGVRIIRHDAKRKEPKVQGPRPDAITKDGQAVDLKTTSGSMDAFNPSGLAADEVGSFHCGSGPSRGHFAHIRCEQCGREGYANQVQGWIHGPSLKTVCSDCRRKKPGPLAGIMSAKFIDGPPPVACGNSGFKELPLEGSGTKEGIVEGMKLSPDLSMFPKIDNSPGAPINARTHPQGTSDAERIERDLLMYGEAFTVDGVRVSPSRVIRHRLNPINPRPTSMAVPSVVGTSMSAPLFVSNDPDIPNRITLEALLDNLDNTAKELDPDNVSPYDRAVRSLVGIVRRMMKSPQEFIQHRERESLRTSCKTPNQSNVGKSKS